MARSRTLPDLVRAKRALAERLSQVRTELFGDRGGPELARRLNLPVRTWYNYESGVTVPAEVILRIIELTSVEPIWLLHGTGPKFRQHESGLHDSGQVPPTSPAVLLRAALELLEKSKSARNPGDAGYRGNGRHASLDTVERMMDSETIAAAPSPPAPARTRPHPAGVDWLDSPKDCQYLRHSGNAMEPIIADGADVAYALDEEDPASLDGRLVTVWVGGESLVRWFQYCGRYAVLRAENLEAAPAQQLIDLEEASERPRIRRVLWITTPH